MQTKLAVEWNQDVNDLDNSTNPNVVVLYEDVTARRRAVRLLATLCDKPGRTFELHPELWRFDILADSKCFGVALADALDADIVIIATSSAGTLNPFAESWINLWLTQRRGTSGVIVLLFCPTTDVDVWASPRLQMLQARAREAGVDFLMPQSPFECSLNVIADKTAPLTISENGDTNIVPLPKSAETLSRTTPYQYCALND